jgi:AcrR family transcriptional regulator
MNTMSTQKRQYRMNARAEAQRRTRQRIAAAAAELHEEVGVKSTTVADIARRANVQRLTVYKHFPSLSELLPACSSHYTQIHPPPELSVALVFSDPLERVRAVLTAYYGWYRATRRLQMHVQGERTTVPELDAFVARTEDAQRREAVAVLAAAFDLRGGHAERLRAFLAVALDFWTWHRLDSEGLSDEAAADLMTRSLCAVTTS